MDDALVKGQERAEAMFDLLPIEAGDTVMLGDSLTEEGPWEELFPDIAIKNRGIGGQTTTQIRDRLDPVLAGKPAVVAFMAGSNDIAAGTPERKILATIEEIVVRIRNACGDSRLIVQSVLPREPGQRQKIESVNRGLLALCESYQLDYLDLFGRFLADDGGICKNLSNDRIHLLPEGYLRWADALRPLLEGSDRD